MSTQKVAITIQQATLSQLDRLVRARRFPNRSKAIQQAVEEKLQRIDRRRLAAECAKLNVRHERALAEEGMAGELRDWPEY